MENKENILNEFYRLSGVKPLIKENEEVIFEDIKSETFIDGDLVNEKLYLKRDIKSKLLYVYSDEEDELDRESETRRYSKKLKDSGFEWGMKPAKGSGAQRQNWAISEDELEKAKKIISDINKTEYIVDTLEDLMEADPEIDELFGGKVSDYINKLVEKVDLSAGSDEVQKVIEFRDKLKNHVGMKFSFLNTLLILVQKPNAKPPIMTRKQWWDLKGRKVVKGADKIWIRRPIFVGGASVKSAEEESMIDDIEAIGGKEMADRFRRPSPTYYKYYDVYDVSDTEQVKEVEPTPEIPQWWADDEPSEIADKIYEAMNKLAELEEIKVTLDSPEDKEGRGSSSRKHIRLKSSISGVGRASTMAHELAHELMHWDSDSTFYVGELPYSIGEVQAESVSFNVLTHYGLPVEHHPTYIALWKGTAKEIKKYHSVIERVSNYVISFIDKYIEYHEKNKMNEAGSIDESEVIIENIFNKIKDKFNIKDFMDKIKTGTKEAKQAFNLLKNNVVHGTELSEEDKDFIKHNLKNILNGLGYATIFALPGGSIILLLTKLLKPYFKNKGSETAEA